MTILLNVFSPSFLSFQVVHKLLPEGRILGSSPDPGRVLKGIESPPVPFSPAPAVSRPILVELLPTLPMYRRPPQPTLCLSCFRGLLIAAPCFFFSLCVCDDLSFLSQLKTSPNSLRLPPLCPRNSNPESKYRFSFAPLLICLWEIVSLFFFVAPK